MGKYKSFEIQLVKGDIVTMNVRKAHFFRSGMDSTK